MRYLCLVYRDEAAPDASVIEDDAGGYDGCDPVVELVDEAVTLRVQDGQLLTTDHPVTLARSHLAGYVVVEARDLNDAIRLASRLPDARLGSIEVRPLKRRGECGS